ncbi:MAG TPA: isochorismatase family protein [Polyangia bacterium]|nr:isochorismatase family protein [Polyangia bacterium]
MAPEDLRIDRERAALLLVDFQERLAAVMAPGEVAAAVRNIVLLFELARQLRIPVVVSEQYPRGLGPTVAALREALLQPGLAIERVEKIEFSCTDSPAFLEVHRKLARDQWIVVGMEAHVCVYQTARGLVAMGARVHVPADAVVSRAPTNVRIGLDLCGRAGAYVTATETVVFDALKRAGTDEFRALSRLLK